MIFKLKLRNLTLIGHSKTQISMERINRTEGVEHYINGTLEKANYSYHIHMYMYMYMPAFVKPKYNHAPQYHPGELFHKDLIFQHSPSSPPDSGMIQTQPVKRR